MSSDLPDVLRDMAADRHPRQPDATGDDASHTSTDAEGLAELDALESAVVEQQHGDAPADDPAGSASWSDPGLDQRQDEPPRSRAYVPRTAARRSVVPRLIQVTALVVVGAVLIALGVWGSLVLDGREVVLSDRPDAQRMARAMILAGYPLGACLLAGAGYFAYRLKRELR